ncbi:gp53-like domain-containing protein [Yersinia enterocolitica]|uniref:gp53-like domain-containing protein n=1 Tax=Yersinia enterocolitica TaxID=630 RepID=UPI003D023342|nr:hypothetical protein [Yersinia enterocolitica]
MALTLLSANNASTVLAAGISASATTLTVNTGTGGLFPSPVSGTSFFKLTLIDAATGTLTEIVHVTARTGDTMTIVRGQEGTVSRLWSANDISANMMTAGTLDLFAQSGTLGGAALLNVGTTVGTVAAGDDPRITASLLKANNLSDLTNVPAALSNLGLGDAAKKGIATNAEMQVGTADKLVSLVGLISIFGKRTFTANDYIRIPDVPGGFIVQFGTATTLASGDTIVTFPIPFPNKVLGIHPSQNNSYTNGAWAAYASKSLSSFALSGWTNATTRIAISVDYFAVGY